MIQEKKSPKKSSLSKKIGSIIFVIILLLILLLVWFIQAFQPVDSNDQTTSTFIIPKGQSISYIGQRLAEAKLIRSPLAFRYLAYKDQLQGKIQAGSFKLSASMSTWEIAQILTKGTDDVWITLPEGWRREEIAASLAKQDLVAFDEAEFLELTKGLEGQLFPDTYLVSKAISTQAVVNLLTHTFESKVLNSLTSQLAQADLTLNQVLTLASLVQRESANEAEMPLVAGILSNRLAINMALQVDASLQYLTGFSELEQSWWASPTAADKELNSAYNTYQHPGLPPAPICNPGLAAIQAALNPQETTALYYLHDLSGQIHTARTLQEHNANISQYLR